MFCTSASAALHWQSSDATSPSIEAPHACPMPMKLPCCCHSPCPRQHTTAWQQSDPMRQLCKVVPLLLQGRPPGTGCGERQEGRSESGPPGSHCGRGCSIHGCLAERGQGQRSARSRAQPGHLPQAGHCEWAGRADPRTGEAPNSVQQQLLIGLLDGLLGW